MSELNYYWRQIQAIFMKVYDGFSFAVAAVRWAARQVRQSIRSSDGLKNDTRSELGALQGMSPKCEVHLFQAGITDLESLAGLDLAAMYPPNKGKVQTKLIHLQKGTVLDWVDQAILICAANKLKTVAQQRSDQQKKKLLDAWLSALRAIGIRTATDFRDAADDEQRLSKALTASHQLVSSQKGNKDVSTVSLFGSSKEPTKHLGELKNHITSDERWKANLRIIEKCLGTK
jgi:hypothetical protein